MTAKILCSLAVAAVIAQAAPRAATLRPTYLRCEYRVDPLGIDVVEPRLSWILTPADPKARGLKQTAYRILAASSEEALRTDKGDLWDTGKVKSGQSIHVAYAGKPVTSGMRVFWKVQIWDQAGAPSGWSETALWTMGLLKAEDWKAKWIGLEEKGVYKHPTSPYRNIENAKWIWSAEADPAKTPAGARFFRATFQIPPGRAVKSAVCIMAADSGYQVSINGTNAGRGNRFQMPEVLDVGAYVRAGENSVTVRATNARNNKWAGLIGALRVDFESGDPLIFTTGASWEVSRNEQGGFTAAKEIRNYGAAPWGEVGFTQEQVLPARLLRKEFEVGTKLKRAMAYVSGLGLFELYLNGAKVGDQVLSPNLTDYDKRTMYVTFDVTKQLAAGKNAAGIMLGNGRYHAPRASVPIGTKTYGVPRLLFQLHLEYADGRTATVVSDRSWKLTANGPIRANNEFDGEEYDARMEMNGWSRAGFDDSAWRAAELLSAPAGMMVAQMSEPLRITETLEPVKVTQLKKGVYIFDMGQNMVGWCRLKVSGPKGTTISLRHAETLKPDGSLYVDNLRSARATDYYTLKGVGQEIWEPRFTYHGFRFVEVSGFPGTPDTAALEGRVVHDSMTRIADFTTSDTLLNRLHKNIFWGVRGNYRSIPTDCPQRDERQGWMGDRSVVSRGESYLFDIAAFYTKWMTDIADAQRPTGSVPDVAPPYWILYNDDVTWPSTFILVPSMLYDQYGDLRVIERDYPAMKKWIEYMRGFIKDNLMPKDTYGDWCVPPESPELIHSKDPARKTNGTLIATAYYHQMLRLMARHATLLEKKEDAAGYEALAGRMKTAFVKKFFQPERNQFDNGTQTSSVLALAFDLVPPENRAAVFEGLIRKIEKESDNHVGVGLVGAQWLMRTLSQNGRADIAYKIATQKTYPGWGYMIEKGATTIWELWNGDTADPAMNSGNHVMQIGDLNVWFYENLAGISPDPKQPGFKHFYVQPALPGDLTFVKASHQSMYGPIASSMKKENGHLQIDVTVPPNTTATVLVPARNPSAVTESGQTATKAKGVKLIQTNDRGVSFELQSGTYSFRSE